MRQRKVTPSYGERLSSRDSINIYGESDRATATVFDAYVFDTGTDPSGPLSHDELVDWMQTRVAVSPIFRRRLYRLPRDLDAPYWVEDPTFDVRNHVRTIEVDGGGWDAVRPLLKESLMRRLDLSRPPWEFELYTGVHGIADLPDNCCIAVLKVHHSVTDGKGTVDIARALFSDAVAASPGSDRVAPDRIPSSAQAVRALPRNYRQFAKALVGSIAANRQLAREAKSDETTSLAHRHPATRFNRPATDDWAFEFVDFSVDEIRGVARAFAPATVNDVLLAVVSGAYSAYLDELGEAAGGSLVATVPFGLRGIREVDSANKFTTEHIDLHSDISAAPDRLRAIHASTKAAKERVRTAEYAKAGQLIASLPPHVMKILTRLGARGNHAGPTAAAHTAISYVQRGAADLVLRRAQVVGTFSLLPVLDGFGLGHFFASVGDRMTITVSVDRAMMPDTAHYAKLLRASLRDLKYAAASEETA